MDNKIDYLILFVFSIWVFLMGITLLNILEGQELTRDKIKTLQKTTEECNR